MVIIFAVDWIMTANYKFRYTILLIVVGKSKMSLGLDIFMQQLYARMQKH